MRSIGKVKLRKLQEMVRAEIKKRTAPYGIFEGNYEAVRKSVRDSIPSEWYDLWECAYTEIENTIDDVIMEER